MNQEERNKASLDEIFGELYETLKPMARARLLGERHKDSYPTCALINDVYERLYKSNINLNDCKSFYGLVGKVMRQILLDRAKRRSAMKRDRSKLVGEETGKLELKELEKTSIDKLLVIEGALSQFEKDYPAQALAVELKHHVGLTQVEIAEVLDCTPRKVSTYWQFAQAWFTRHLGERDG